MAEADAEVAQLGQLADDLVGHQVEAAGAGAQGDLTLEPHRRAIVPRACRRARVAAERHALGLEPRALAVALRQRPVGAHDAVPREVGVVVRVEHRAGEARRARRDVAVAADEARRDLAHAREHGFSTRAR